jgi:hypothetical protein
MLNEETGHEDLWGRGGGIAPRILDLALNIGK